MTAFRFATLALALALPALPALAQHGNGWTVASTPAAGAARAIGYYANGCIRGAVALPLEGPGWRVLRPQRNRNWGHPDMVAALRELARRVRTATGKVLLVADIAQPRGGPATGHASHQVGLDADVRFQLAPDGPLDPVLRDEGTELTMVADGKEIDRTRWNGDQLAMLRIAAELPAVDRIFVNPVIKREACRAAGGDRRWLAKVVPWYGHDGHMHVRIRCPADSPDCRPQDPLPADDGCGAALAWWFTSEPFRQHASRGPAKRPEPPAACLALWKR
ncbi:MAG: penicillin-insensitive murein endopeptidase [Alphaproteobacteria bacterium]